MKIAIIGAGAMGCLYGSILSKIKDNQIFLLDIWKDHIDKINAEGLTVEEDGKDQLYQNLRAVSRAEEAGICDLAIVFVKSTMTSTAVYENKAIFGVDTTVLTLQNGLGNVDIIGDIVGKSNVIAGTTSHGATMLEPGKIRHAGRGKTIIGEISGEKTPRILKIFKLFEETGTQIEIATNVTGLIWDKLLVNVGINALTGISRLTNGDLLSQPELISIMEDAVEEGLELAQAKGVELTETDPFEHTRRVCELTSKNKSSMLQDIMNNKKTEIDMINGAIVREGAKIGLKMPVNKTLTGLIKYFEKNSKNK